MELLKSKVFWFLCNFTLNYCKDKISPGFSEKKNSNKYTSITFYGLNVRLLYGYWLFNIYLKRTININPLIFFFFFLFWFILILESDGSEYCGPRECGTTWAWNRKSATVWCWRIFSTTYVSRLSFDEEKFICIGFYCLTSLTCSQWWKLYIFSIFFLSFFCRSNNKPQDFMLVTIVFFISREFFPFFI